MATTPRPFIFEHIANIGTADKPGTTVQFENGNGKIYYQRDGKIYCKSATVNQGHWQNMVLGNEVQNSNLDIKDFSMAQAIPDAAFGLAIVSEEVDNKTVDKMYLIIDNYDLNTHEEKLIKSIL